MGSTATQHRLVRVGHSPAAAWRRAIRLPPLLGLAGFLAYFAFTAWPHADLRAPLATPSGGCALMLGYMAWPIGFALRAFRR